MVIMDNGFTSSMQSGWSWPTTGGLEGKKMKNEHHVLARHSIQPVTTPEQIVATAELASTIWNEHFPAIIGQAQVDYMVERFQSATAIADQIRTGVLYHLLLLDQEPVGYMALIPDSPQGKLMISKLYLKRSTRGKGLGKAMLDFAIQQARSRNCASVWLTVNRHNRSSVEWYQRRGFSITCEKDKDIGSGYRMDDYVMELAVAKSMMKS